MLHNPVYSGIVTVAATKDEEIQFVKGMHEPLISEQLFQDVQSLFKCKRRQQGRTASLKYLFPLRGFLICPYCNRVLTGSVSKGRSANYTYYHFYNAKCKGRFRADVLNCGYEARLRKIGIRPEVNTLFKLVLKDENLFSTKNTLLEERDFISRDIEKQHLLLTRARRLLLDSKIDHEDFGSIKKEITEVINNFNNTLSDINIKLTTNYSDTIGEWNWKTSTIFKLYENQDIADKRFMINLFQPSTINPFTGDLGPLNINPAIAKIIAIERKIKSQLLVLYSSTNKQNAIDQLFVKRPQAFNNKKVSVNQNIET